MADTDEELTGPAEVDTDATIPDAISGAGVDDGDTEALEVSADADHLTDEGPGDAGDGTPLESSESETTDQDEENRPVSRRELARQNDSLKDELKALLEERDRALEERSRAAKALEDQQKSQAELEKDFFELVGTDDEFNQADHLSRYSDDPYEREQALEKFTRLRSMREKLPKAWLWYVGKIAGADVQEFATETKLDATALFSAPRMKDLLTTVRAESVKSVEASWKAKYDALEAKLKAEQAAHDATKAKSGSSVPSPERGGRAATGAGGLTLERWRGMSSSDRREFLSTPEGKAKYNALTRSLQGVA